MEHLLTSVGLGLLFALILFESAGIPLPGETALIAAGLLASKGRYEIWQVIVIAALAAIVGDNLGYWAARRWGHQIADRWKLLARYRDKAMPPAERFFKAHGGKTVFIARFVAILRFTVAWLAGMTRMDWWKFFFWNAAGGICWAVGIGLLAYYGGKAAAEAFDKYGLIAVGVIAVVVVVGLVGTHFWRKRLMAEE